MRKIIKYILICLFTCFSFYYTDKIVEFTKQKDPIMIEINKVKTTEEITPVNAIITKDTMLVGISGTKINEELSYEKMKKLNSFNKSLLEYTSVKPKITKDQNYDKLIKGKNTKEKEISFIFQIENIEKLDEIIYILEKNNVTSTFFLDGKIIEENSIYLKNELKTQNKLGYYGYDKKYNEINFRYLQGLIKNNFKHHSKYCLYINEEYLNTCKNYKINTISPITIEKNLYNYIKQNKENGYIYQIKTNDLNIKELNSTLIYLKQKGYKILNIDKLLKE